VHVIFASMQQKVSCVGELEGAGHVDVLESYADAFVGFLTNAMDFEAFLLDFYVEYASCRLPVNGFVTDWAVDEEAAVGFNDKKSFTGFESAACSANVVDMAGASNDESSPLSESFFDEHSRFGEGGFL
jgi:hypothetical protein